MPSCDYYHSSFCIHEDVKENESSLLTVTATVPGDVPLLLLETEELYIT